MMSLFFIVFLKRSTSLNRSWDLQFVKHTPKSSPKLLVKLELWIDLRMIYGLESGWIYRRNDSKRNFNYRMQMLVGANRRPKASFVLWILSRFFWLRVCWGLRKFCIGASEVRRFHCKMHLWVSSVRSFNDYPQEEPKDGGDDFSTIEVPRGPHPNATLIHPFNFLWVTLAGSAARGLVTFIFTTQKTT